MSWKVQTLVLTLAFVLAACTPSGGPVGASRPVEDPAVLDDSEWWLVSVDGDPVTATNTEPPINLRFHAAGPERLQNEFGAFAGCNHLGGTFNLDADPVFTRTGITPYNCDAMLTAQESAILSALDHVTALQLDEEGQLLAIDGQDEIRLRFAPKPAPQIDPALADTEWRLQSLLGEPAVAGVPVTLDVDGNNLGGDTGCNGYGGEVRQLADGRFSVPEIAVTQVECPGPQGKQEATYLDLLWRQVSGYRLDEDQLHLLNEDGLTLAIFDRREQAINDPNALAHTTWLLTSVDGESPVAPRPLILHFHDLGPDSGRYSGQDACRSYVGAFVATDDDISFFSVSMLGEPCPDEQPLLPSGGDYALTDEQLSISGPRGTYQYTQLPAGGDYPLLGTTWHLLALVGGDGSPSSLQATPPGTILVARFGDSTVSGNIGCKSYEGPYTLNGEQLSFGALAAIEQACSSAEIMNQQQTDYLTNLESATSYTMAGPHLWLNLADGRALLYTATP